MAAVVRYVDTASAGGDGTTQGHSGATAAYASLSSWESSEQTNLTTGPDTHTVHCAGSTADSTALRINGWTTSATANITVMGDRSAPDGDGFYGGTDTISTSHYRIALTGVGTCFRASDPHITFDGLQGHSTYSAANYYIFEIDGNADGSKLLRCRALATGSSFTSVVLLEASQNSDDLVCDSNLIVGGDIGINFDKATFFTGNDQIFNNTVYGANTAGIDITFVGSNSGATLDVKNNVVHSTTTAGGDLVVTNTGGGTINYDTNAFEDSEGTTNEVSISGSASTYFTSPSVATSADFHIVNDCALHNDGIDVGEDTDADDVSRSADTTGYDIGCFVNNNQGEFGNIWGVGTQGLDQCSGANSVTASDIKTTPLTGLPAAYTHILECSIQNANKNITFPTYTDNSLGDPFLGDYVVVGFYVRFSTVAPNDAVAFCSGVNGAAGTLTDPGTTTPNGFNMVLEADGDLRVDFSSGGGATATTPFTADTWHRIEIRTFTAASNITTFDVWVDGSSVMTATSKRIQDAYLDYIALGANQAGTGTESGSIYFAGAYTILESAFTEDRLDDDFEVLYYQTDVTGTTPSADGAGTGSGTALDSGDWGNTADTPGSDANIAEYTSNNANGSVNLDGPNGDANVDGDANIRAALGIWRAQRTNGSDPGFTHYFGNAGGAANDMFSVSAAIDGSIANFYAITSDANELPTSTEDLRMGFGKGSGGRDYQCREMWGVILHVPDAVTSNTSTVSLDGAIAKAVLSTASVDAAVQSTRESASTLDAYLASVVSSSTDIDAVVAALSSVSASLSGALEKRESTFASVDAAVETARELSTNVDAALQSLRSVSASMDAYLEAIVSSSISASLDAALSVNREVSTSLDAAVQVAGAVVLSLDLVLSKINDATATLDAAVQSGEEITVDLQAAVSNSVVLAASLDAAVSSLVFATTNLEAVIMRSRAQTVSLDASISVPGLNAQTVSLDAALRGVVSSLLSMDAALSVTGAADTSLDAALSVAGVTSNDIDAVVSALRSVSASYDSAIQSTLATTVSLDANLVAAGFAGITLSMDAAVLAIRSATLSLNAALSALKTAGVSVDAALSIAKEKSAVVDAVVQAARTAEADFDAAVEKLATHAVSMDAALVSSQIQSVSVDTVLAAMRQQALSMDGWLSKTQQQNLDMEAAIRGLVSRGVSLDAFISPVVADLLYAPSRAFKVYGGRSSGITPNRGFKVPRHGRFN